MCFAVSFSARAATELRVGNVFAVPGGTALIPIHCTTDTNLVAAQFDLVLSSINLTASDATPGPALADHEVTCGDPEIGVRRVVIHSPTNRFLRNGVWVFLPLTLTSNMPHSPLTLTLTNVMLATFDGEAATNWSLVSGNLLCTSMVVNPPVITVQPQNQAIWLGGSVTLQVTVGGTEPLVYRWRRNGLDLTDGDRISGSGTSTLTITNTQSSDAAAYSVVVSNAADQESSSSAVLSVVNVAAWGDNGEGQVSAPAGLSNAVAIAAAHFHILALREDRTVAAWGWNNFGQASVPVGLSNVVAIAGGYMHSLALRTDGTVIGWGQESYGLGEPLSRISNVVAIAHGWWHSLVLHGDGTVNVWGNNDYGQTNMPPGLCNVVAIAAGQHHSLALRADGTLVGWGWNRNGQAEVGGVSNVVAMRCGNEQNYVIRADGTTFAWGINSSAVSSIPAGLSNLVAIAGGRSHSMALLENGTVETWGLNYEGQTSDPSGLSNVVAIACGEWSSMALIGQGPPVVLTPRIDRKTLPGGTVVFSIEATGAWPLSYQWFHEGSPLLGATRSSFFITNAHSAHAGSYSVVVSNTSGSVTSWVGNLMIGQPLAVYTEGSGTILVQPFSNRYQFGQAVSLTATPSRWHEFLRWSDGDTNNPRTITIGLSNTYSAIFTNSTPLEIWTNALGEILWQVPVGTPKVLINGEPTFGGSFTFTSTNPPLVDLQTSFPGGVIFYTDDGSDPRAGPLYDGVPFIRSTSAGLWTVAFDAAYTQEALGDPVNITIIPVYTISLATNGLGGVTLDPPGGIYLSNTLVTLTATPADGWGFSGWSGDATGHTATAALRMDGSKSVSATFYQIPVYALTVVTNGSGSVTLDPPGGSYPSNSVVQLMATPAPEWFFNGWTVDTGGFITNNAQTNLTLVLNQPATVTALFGAMPKYWLTAGTAGGGSVTFSPTNNPFLSNTVVSVSATTNAGWTFLGWAGDATGSNPVLHVTMDRARSLQAIFGTGLTTPSIGTGTVQRWPASGPYPYASKARLSAVPDPGNFFRQWGGAASGLSNSPLSFVVSNANPVVSALFATLSPVNRTLTVFLNGDGNVSKSPQLAFYSNGASVLLTATPGSGSGFMGWSGDVSATENPLSVTMNSNKSITGNFATVQPPGITSQPQDQVVMLHSNAPFRVLATGTLPLSYHWFFNTTNLLAGEANATLVRTNAQLSDAGTYSVTVSNAYGFAASSNALLTVLVPNSPPSIGWLAPSNGAAFTAPAQVLLSAHTSDPDGTVEQVMFLSGAALVGVSTNNQSGNFQADLVWTNVPVGTHSLTSVALDNGGLMTTSAPVSISVETVLPQIALSAPTNNAVFTTPANVRLHAVATDADNSIGHVALYANGDLVGSVTNLPYELFWSNSPVGNHVLTAVAVDLHGPAVTSAPVHITVEAPANQLPLVNLTWPSNGMAFTAGTNLLLSASAADPDGTVVLVEFLADTNVLG